VDNLQSFIRQIRWRLVAALLLANTLLFAVWWLETMAHVASAWIALTLGLGLVGSAVGLAMLAVHYLIGPLRFIWQAVLHVSADGGRVPAPNVESLNLGRDLVGGLLNRIYQLATVTEQTAKNAAQPTGNFSADQIASRLPLPLFVFDKNKVLVFANEAALNYLQIKAEASVGRDIYSLLNVSFPSKDTLDSWLTEASRSSATASRSWERVRLNLSEAAGSSVRLFDLAAYYNRDNPLGYELLLVLFDHTANYSQGEQTLSFVSLAVHELRTPITLLRGYIEALEEDLNGKLPAEDEQFLQRTEVAGQQLAAFVNNVLNVARVEDNQFVVQLHEEAWPDVIKAVVADYSLHARLADITIETDIAPGLPTVGIDRLSMYEVLSNLLDNAIKYSPKKSIITIKTSLTADGLVETSVQDSGIGIPASVIPHLFDKFYRSHRSRGQVGGTGLGLYLCKTIVTAHGGNIWVRSHEDQGSTFGFTL
jgi:signal transduction histidine kinase